MDQEQIQKLLRPLDLVLSKPTRLLRGFSVDFTDNGFVISTLMVEYDVDGSEKAHSNAFSFSEEVRLSSCLELLSSKHLNQKFN